MRVHFALGSSSEIGGWAAYARELRAAFTNDGMAVTATAYGPVLRRLPTGLRHALYLIRLVPGALRADAVLAFDTWSAGLPAAAVASLLGKPLVVRIGGDFLWEQYVERTGDLVPLSQFYLTSLNKLSLKERITYHGTQYLLRRASCVAFNSAWQRDIWRKAYGEDFRAAVIENVFPERLPRAEPARRIFVAAGRPIRLKNEAFLREAFERVRARHPDIELDTRPLPPALHQERVAGCYAVVLASVSDVAPNAIIDAVRYGKPFIAPQETGLRERLTGTGLFIDTLDRAALERGLLALLEPAEYERVGAAVRAYSFTRPWRDVAKEFQSLIERVAR